MKKNFVADFYGINGKKFVPKTEKKAKDIFKKMFLNGSEEFKLDLTVSHKEPSPSNSYLVKLKEKPL